MPARSVEARGPTRCRMVMPQNTENLTQFSNREELLVAFSNYIMVKYEVKEKCAKAYARMAVQCHRGVSGDCWVIPDYGYSTGRVPLDSELMHRRDIFVLAESLDRDRRPLPELIVKNLTASRPHS